MSNDIVAARSGPEYIGLFHLAAGVLFALWRRKRKFDRTNAFGVEQFPGHFRKLVAGAKDEMLGGASLIFSCAGVLLLAFRSVDSWVWIIVLPGCAFLLVVLVVLIGM